MTDDINDTPPETPATEEPTVATDDPYTALTPTGKPKKKYNRTKKGWKEAYRKSTVEEYKARAYTLGLYSSGRPWVEIEAIFREKFNRDPPHRETINLWARQCGLQDVRYNSVKALQLMGREHKDIIGALTTSLADAMRERSVQVAGEMLEMVHVATKSVAIKSATEMSHVAVAASRLMDTGLNISGQQEQKETREIEAIDVTPISSILMGVFQQAISEGIVTTEAATKIMELLEARMSLPKPTSEVVDVAPVIEIVQDDEDDDDGDGVEETTTGPGEDTTGE